jgi:diguanylate cyclase (GGDEF)-like protein
LAGSGRERARLDDLRRESEGLRETAAALRVENAYLQRLLVLLPDLTRQLNRRVEKRDVAPLLMQSLGYLFEPEDILVFYRARRERALILAARKAQGPGPQRGVRVSLGEGIVGEVAADQVTFDRLEQPVSARAPRGLTPALGATHQVPDICVPMVYETATLGVIALYGVPSARPNERKIVRLIGDLAAIALNNIAVMSYMQFTADVDGLTGLLNKKRFLARLTDQVERARQAGRPLTVLMLDIDHFKNYNDLNGHVAGDDALARTAAVIRGEIRADDLAARFGGEEFVIAFPDTAKSAGFEAAEKLRAAVEHYPYPGGSGQPLGRVTLSGGVASFPEDGAFPADLIARADAALYQAKEQGRNRIVAVDSGSLHGAEPSGPVSDPEADVPYEDGEMLIAAFEEDAGRNPPEDADDLEEVITARVPPRG